MYYTFLTGFIISALGSVPFGVINLTIIQIAVNKGLKAAFQFIFIALLAEYFHVLLALWLFNYIHHYPAINLYFEWAAIVFILVMAVGSLAKKPSEINLKNKNISFWRAVIINFLNPFSIPFWLFFTTYAQHAGWLSEDFNGQMYCIAATLGAFVTLAAYAFTGKELTRWSMFRKLNIDKILGWIFILMAVWRIFKMVG